MLLTCNLLPRLLRQEQKLVVILQVQLIIYSLNKIHAPQEHLTILDMFQTLQQHIISEFAHHSAQLTLH
jgi:hypothetical protein